MNITKRDLKMIGLGFLTFFIIEGVYNWKYCLKSFKDGWNSVR
ncbi:hypothetical protein [Flavobacterium sp. A45]|uniref:Uncharacterized protein n=1 Tax=Flavobacterium granuli TaxID=280093 RepID=A0ABU1S6F5_9FLAO|nr:hypothetical protein [Flavobacterium sp. A45]MDR6846622.1 hypothetical protein [Flavobacterium granuli]